MHGLAAELFRIGLRSALKRGRGQYTSPPRVISHIKNRANLVGLRWELIGEVVNPLDELRDGHVQRGIGWKLGEQKGTEIMA